MCPPEMCPVPLLHGQVSQRWALRVWDSHHTLLSQLRERQMQLLWDVHWNRSLGWKGDAPLGGRGIAIAPALTTCWTGCTVNGHLSSPLPTKETQHRRVIFALCCLQRFGQAVVSNKRWGWSVNHDVLRVSNASCWGSKVPASPHLCCPHEQV